MQPIFGGPDYEMWQAFSNVKRTLRKISGSDDAYYAVLNWEGYEKSSQILTRETGRMIYKRLRLQVRNWQAWWADQSKRAA